MENVETAWSAAEAGEQLAYAADPELLDEPAAFADDTPPEPADLLAAEALCPACGELLAWYDEFTSCAPTRLAGLAAPPQPAGQQAADASQEPAAEPLAHPRPAGPGTGGGSFAYELGHRVQPTPALTAQVIWRGQLKERHPATGLIHRVNVYRLNDGYWDCYREDDLRAA